MQRTSLLHKRTIRKRRQAARLRMTLITVFTLLIITGAVALFGALGGLEYDMPLYRGIKQIIFGGIALGVGLGGRYALG